MALIIKCSSLGDWSTLDDFVKSHFYNSEGVYFCSLCGYSNKFLTNVKNHVEANHTPGYLKSVQCGECEKVCPSRNALRMHVKRAHNK